MTSIQQTESNERGEMSEPKVSPSPTDEVEQPPIPSPDTDPVAENGPDAFNISNWRLVLMTIGILLTYLTVRNSLLQRLFFSLLTHTGWN